MRSRAADAQALGKAQRFQFRIAGDAGDQQIEQVAIGPCGAIADIPVLEDDPAPVIQSQFWSEACFYILPPARDGPA